MIQEPNACGDSCPRLSSGPQAPVCCSTTEKLVELRSTGQPRAAGPTFPKEYEEKNPYTACFTTYMSSISDVNRCAITSRFSFPLAVSRPFSIVKASRMILKLCTCL